MADDIVTQLRADYPPNGCKCILCQAAHEIERLRAELAALRADWKVGRE